MRLLGARPPCGQNLEAQTELSEESSFAIMAFLAKRLKIAEAVIASTAQGPNVVDHRRFGNRPIAVYVLINAHAH